MRVIAQNKKASFDYELSDTFEAGIVLTGPEIKAVRAGKVQITGSYVKVLANECHWLGGIIQSGTNEQRTRKLLVHRKEINTLIGKTEQKGFSLVATKLYLKRNNAKLEFALAKGRKEYDKRAKIRRKDERRQEE
ncbi:SsrA-binding protein SmpB [Candidatus Berkelbacteria bacterium]|nr:SsrA-binding protein SmpB [Candidatus Berkelbacteria bacterium]